MSSSDSIPVFDYVKYLSSKQSVDDRALSNQTYQNLTTLIKTQNVSPKFYSLEIGSGIGAMFTRMMNSGTFGHVSDLFYTMVELNPDCCHAAAEHCKSWAVENGWNASETVFLDADLIPKDNAQGKDFQSCASIDKVHRAKDNSNSFRGLMHKITLRNSGLQIVQNVTLEIICADALQYALQNRGAFDLLIASAFLDLIDIPSSLPGLLQTLRGAESIYYFSINFDGTTYFSPSTGFVSKNCDAVSYEDKVENYFHALMDRTTDSGEVVAQSHSGRKLAQWLKNAHATIESSSGSSWIVIPSSKGYHKSEQYFLFSILHFMESTLMECSEFEPSELKDFFKIRRKQLTDGELNYIAHNMDYCGLRG